MARRSDHNSKLQPSISEGWCATEAEEKQVALHSATCFLRQHLNRGEGGEVNGGTCVPFQHTPQNQVAGKEKNGTCPDVMCMGMQPENTRSTTARARSDSPEDQANGIWKNEQKGGKRNRGCLRVTGAELWLQPPCKCFSQQGVSLRNFRNNMPTQPAHLQSPQHPRTQLRPNPTLAKFTSTIIYKHYHMQKPCRLRGLCPWPAQLMPILPLPSTAL